VESKLWFIGIILLVVLYLCVRILENLPAKTKSIQFASRTTGSSDFAVWMVADDLWFDEFQVGHIDEWLLGHKFTVWGTAEYKPEWEIKRGAFTFYAARNALSEFETIGWGKKGTQSVDLHISLTPDVAKNLFDELRRCPSPHLHAQGFVGPDDKIKITYFTMSPQENSISLKQN
jgi:hypothetical protein